MSKFKFGDWVETPEGFKGIVVISGQNKILVCAEENDTNWWLIKDCKPAKQPLLDFLRQHNIRNAFKSDEGWYYLKTEKFEGEEFTYLHESIFIMSLNIEFPTDTDTVSNPDWRKE